MANNTILLLNTLESRQLKKEGTLCVERAGQILTLSYDKHTKNAQVVSVERKGVSYIDPFESDYELRLTQEEHKTLVEKGSVVCVRAKCNYLVTNEGAFPQVDFTQVYVR